MSGATYRIDVEHRPIDTDGDTDTPYYASICRLSDGYYVDVKSGRTADEALNRARAVVASLNATEDTRTYYVDDDAAFVPGHPWRPSDPTLKLLREYSVKARVQQSNAGGFGETYAVEVEPLQKEGQGE